MRYRIAVLGFFLAILTFAARADSGLPPFDQVKFDQALAQGQSIVVHTHADWCTTCRAQVPHLRAAMNDPAYAKVAFFQIDVDQDNGALGKLHFTGRSQIKVFKGGKEIAYEVGITAHDKIMDVLKSAL